jgi:hypothetical protein
MWEHCGGKFALKCTLCCQKAFCGCIACNVLILECSLKMFAFRLLQYTQHKGYGDDITEQKFSFPVIH